MFYSYRIEMWNKISCRYVIYWQGNSKEMAEKMMFKPYNEHVTRRLIQATEEVLYVEKAKKK